MTLYEKKKTLPSRRTTTTSGQRNGNRPRTEMVDGEKRPTYMERRIEIIVCSDLTHPPIERFRRPSLPEVNILSPGNEPLQGLFASLDPQSHPVTGMKKKYISREKRRQSVTRPRKSGECFSRNRDGHLAPPFLPQTVPPPPSYLNNKKRRPYPPRRVDRVGARSLGLSDGACGACGTSGACDEIAADTYAQEPLPIHPSCLGVYRAPLSG